MARDLLSRASLQHLLSLFVLSCLCHANPKGQQTIIQAGLASFKELLTPNLIGSADARLRQWTCITIGKCWHGFGHAKTTAAADGIPEVLVQVLMDPVPDVRCAALWALGAFFGGKILQPASGAPSATSPTQAARTHALRAQARLDLEIHLGAAMSTLINDGSPLVRRELMLALAELVYFQQDLFLAIATAHPRNRESISVQGWYIWRAILRGCRDCSLQVQEVSLAIKGYLKGRAILNQSQLGRMIASQHNPGLTIAPRDTAAAYHENIEEEDGVESALTDADAAARTSATDTDGSDARATTRFARSARPDDRQSIAHIDADDISAQDDATMPHDFHDRDSAPHVSRAAHNQPPIRHFTRFKMGHLRPGGGGIGGAAAATMGGLPGAAGGQRRTAEKTSILKSLESPIVDASKSDSSVGGTATLDERAADQMWTVPKSRVFEDAYLAFTEPMLQPSATADDRAQMHLPTMSEIRHTKWRHARNQAIHAHARELQATHPAKASYVEVTFLNAEWEGTSCVAFHQYETMLLAADLHRTVGVWNYAVDEERGRERLNTFSNDNPPGTKITQLEVINDAAVSLLLVATDEGVVRIWRGVHEEGRQQLVTAWVANPQPEVFYANGTAQNTTNAPIPTTPVQTQLDNNVITPTHSFQDASGSLTSSMAPQARLSGRHSTGVGVPLTPSGQPMRHSASTPLLAPSSSTPSSRTGSLISAAGSLLLPATAANNLSRSPMSKAASSGAINIPPHTLAGQTTATTPQAYSHGRGQSVTPNASQTASWAAGPSSRRKQRPPLIVEWQQNRGRLVTTHERGHTDNTAHIVRSTLPDTSPSPVLSSLPPVPVCLQLASGNGLECLRLWDVSQEQCVSEIPIFGHESREPHLPSYVTSITTNGGDMSWLGCHDGALRCFDLRLPPVERYDRRNKETEGRREGVEPPQLSSCPFTRSLFMLVSCRVLCACQPGEHSSSASITGSDCATATTRTRRWHGQTIHTQHNESCVQALLQSNQPTISAASPLIDLSVPMLCVWPVLSSSPRRSVAISPWPTFEWVRRTCNTYDN